MSEAENLLWSIRAAGWQEPDAPRILDFGCGTGTRVY
jgi:SAM-dependent methyltransferase